MNELTRKRRSRSRGRALAVTLTLAVLTAPALAVALGPTPALAATDTIVSNNSLVFRTGEQVTMTGAIPGDLPWTLRNAATGTEVEAGTTGAGNLVDLGALPVGYYEVAIGEVPVKFAVIGEEPSDDPYYSVATKFSAFKMRAGYDPNSELPADLKALGFDTFREAGDWNDVENPTKGNYRTTQNMKDGWAAEAATDQNVIWTTAFGNGHHTGGWRQPALTPEAGKGFAAFTNWYLSQDPQITEVEIYNEFNGGFNESTCKSGTCYVEMLKNTVPAIRAAHPNVKIIGGSTAGVPLEWFQEMFAAGGLEYLDVISAHPYNQSTTTGYADVAANLNNLQRTYLPAGSALKPISYTEIGWSTAFGAGNAAQVRDEFVQAERVVHAYTVPMQTPNMAGVTWYDAVNDAVGNSVEANFGLFTQPSANVTAAQPKAGALAFWVMRDQIDAKSVVASDRITGGTASRIVYREADSSAQTTVLWSGVDQSNGAQRAVNSVSNSVTGVIASGHAITDVTSTYGQANLPMGSATTLTSTSEPKYVQSVKPTAASGLRWATAVAPVFAQPYLGAWKVSETKAQASLGSARESIDGWTRVKDGWVQNEYLATSLPVIASPTPTATSTPTSEPTPTVTTKPTATVKPTAKPTGTPTTKPSASPKPTATSDSTLPPVTTEPSASPTATTPVATEDTKDPLVATDIQISSPWLALVVLLLGALAALIGLTVRRASR